jgi:hypothetical protein
MAASGAAPRAGEIPLHLDAIKLRLEDMLLDAGVKLIYASLPVGLCVEDGRLRGAIVGNKSGRQVIRCRTVVDATATALVHRLAGAAFIAPGESQTRFYATLEWDGAGPLQESALEVPPELGLVDDQVRVHVGYRGEGHLLLEIGLDLESRPGDELRIRAAYQAQARKKIVRLAVFLRRHLPAFRDAYPAASSYELHGPHTMPLAGPVPGWAKPLATEPILALSLRAAAPGVRWLPADAIPTSLGKSSGVALSLRSSQRQNCGLSSFAGPIAGLWYLNEAARVSDDLRPQLGDPCVAAQLGAALGRALDDHWSDPCASAADDPPALKPPHAATGASKHLVVAEPAAPQRGRDYKLAPVPWSPVPVARDVDAVIVGGGSSGAVAGIQAGLEGLRATIVDMNPGLGGTGTYGGIYTYWFGQRNRYAGTVLGWVNEIHDALGLPRPEGVLARWNVEARIWALAEQAEQAGVELLTNAAVIGAVVEEAPGGERVVRGVVVATRYGPVALLGRTVIDATGDGDVAAYAGAEVQYGSTREQAVMYAYMPQVPSPGRPRNVKTSMLDVRNVEDYTRMILTERRRREDGDHDHGVYLAPRESRHVRGQVTLTFTDQLVKRAWSDAVTVAFSNHDIKGESTSDWIRMGLQAPNLEIEIPYRALLPVGLRNLLVVGKAFSMTHDASAGPRMQRDLENLGAAAAVAAALAARAGVPVGEVDVRALQARLVKIGALPERVLDRRLVPLSFTDAQLRAQIEALDVSRPLYAYAGDDFSGAAGEHYQGRVPPVDLMCAGPQVVPLLEEALSTAHGSRRLLLARMLAVLGSQAGVPALVSALERLLAGARLPGRGTGVPYVGVPPDQGAAPEAAHLLTCLGLARDRRALPLWQRAVDLLSTATMEDVFDRRQALYFYAAAVCYGCEQLGDPEAIPVLRQLYGYPTFRGHVSPTGTPRAGIQADYREERLAYLETLLGRALARCGSPQGYVILIDYLQDARALLAEHAHGELAQITGCDCGKNLAAWGQWLEEAGEDLTPVPWRGPSEPVAAWGKPIQVEADELREGAGR